jgi:hypothetical protein
MSAPAPDLDAEADVDLGRYARALAARWWLPLAGLIAGAAIGYVLSLGGHQVYRAGATVYLGQPLGLARQLERRGESSMRCPMPAQIRIATIAPIKTADASFDAVPDT